LARYLLPSGFSGSDKGWDCSQDRTTLCLSMSAPALLP
jgi:hypothetical protein